ncbi:hypothetical protein NM688_g2658 [Phlebia brevispora]|uniref:Uncharacterized protein n=1 Tax=Phlebia brevispora TaxID=194682 RepID=A0ACC1T7R6_9APHY|nr:hypothetical protein NM688_g2658 [Phlebia brevispora]
MPVHGEQIHEMTTHPAMQSFLLLPRLDIRLFCIYRPTAHAAPRDGGRRVVRSTLRSVLLSGWLRAYAAAFMFTPTLPLFDSSSWWLAGSALGDLQDERPGCGGSLQLGALSQVIALRENVVCNAVHRPMHLLRPHPLFPSSRVPHPAESGSKRSPILSAVFT